MGIWIVMIALFVLALLLRFLIWPGTSRMSLLEDELIKQYGPRTGRWVAVLMFLLFLLGAFGLAWLRRGWIWGLFKALK